jgi:hypothetical protein
MYSQLDIIDAADATAATAVLVAGMEQIMASYCD